MSSINPILENQGVVSLNVDSTSYVYDLLTDNPNTEEVDDPTTVVLSYSPDNIPPLPTQTIDLSELSTELIFGTASW